MKKVTSSKTGTFYKIESYSGGHFYLSARSFKDGQLHKMNGPAVIMNILSKKESDISKFWYQHGILHRLDGPAYIVGGFYDLYAVDGKISLKSKWEKHPSVVGYKIEKVIKEILSE